MPICRVVIGLVFINPLFAIDNPLGREIQPRNLMNQYNLTIYDLSGIPPSTAFLTRIISISIRCMLPMIITSLGGI
jgi:hypothetical protein